MQTLWNSPDFFKTIYDLIFFALVIPSLITGLVTTLWQQKLEPKNKKYRKIHLFSKISWTTGFIATILLWSIGKRMDAINSVQQKALQTELKVTKASTDTLRNELIATREELTNAQELQKENEEFFREELERAHDRLSKSKNPIVPRSLSKTQRTKLLTALTNGIKDSIIVRCQLSDNESVSFANKLLEIFKQSGWKTKIRYGVYSNPPTTLVVVANKEESEFKYFDFVLKSLKDIGLPVQGLKATNKEKFPIGVTTLVVGIQPRN